MHDHVFPLEPSQSQRFLFQGVVSLAEVCILFTPMPWFAKLLATFILMLYAYYVQAFVIPLCLPQSIVSIERSLNAGEWQVTCPSGVYPAALLPSTCVTQWFIVVHFKAATGKRFSALISRDMLSNRSYRHLLCRLIEPPVAAYDLHQLPQR